MGENIVKVSEKRNLVKTKQKHKLSKVDRDIPSQAPTGHSMASTLLRL